MGAMITIHYDGKVVSEDEARTLAEAAQQLIAEVIKEKDVFVYATAAPITIGADPIEILVQVNQQKVPDPEALTQRITAALSNWKRQTDFKQPLNLNVIPVDWHYKIGV